MDLAIEWFSRAADQGYALSVDMLKQIDQHSSDEDDATSVASSDPEPFPPQPFGMSCWEHIKFGSVAIEMF